MTETVTAVTQVAFAEHPGASVQPPQSQASPFPSPSESA